MAKLPPNPDAEDFEVFFKQIENPEYEAPRRGFGLGLVSPRPREPRVVIDELRIQREAKAKAKVDFDKALLRKAVKDRHRVLLAVAEAEVFISEVKDIFREGQQRFSFMCQQRFGAQEFDNEHRHGEAAEDFFFNRTDAPGIVRFRKGNKHDGSFEGQPFDVKLHRQMASDRNVDLQGFPIPGSTRVSQQMSVQQRIGLAFIIVVWVTSSNKTRFYIFYIDE